MLVISIINKCQIVIYIYLLQMILYLVNYNHISTLQKLGNTNIGSCSLIENNIIESFCYFVFLSFTNKFYVFSSNSEI